MTEEQIEQLANEIAADLFTNGNRQKAARLLLVTNHPTDNSLGGWGEKPMADRIREHLMKALKS